jgi:hypothetical protein
MDETPPCRAAPLFFHSASGVSGMGGNNRVRIAATIASGFVPLVLYGIAQVFGGQIVALIGAGLILSIACYICPAWDWHR